MQSLYDSLSNEEIEFKVPMIYDKLWVIIINVNKYQVVMYYEYLLLCLDLLRWTFPAWLPNNLFEELF